MTEKIGSIKHKGATRVSIPSKEEAGYEDANQRVQRGKRVLELPVNPVVTRGQDPELFWMDKYGNDDREDLLKVDIRSLYRHEHIAPETLIKNLYRVIESDDAQSDLFGTVNDLFGNALDKDELEKVSDYYSHQDGWTNRLIQGDSHLVMASLLEREGMAGQVQMIYMDPPYGIKYGSNWQIKLNSRDITDGSDDSLTGEPEVVKAFRDTWELGVHSYLSYIRDRLLIAKELLTENGSFFIQISDENVHLVRSVLDEVFGSGNFVSQIFFQKTGGHTPKTLPNIGDHLLWYAKDIKTVKYRQLFDLKERPDADDPNYVYLELEDGSIRKMTPEERRRETALPKKCRIFRLGPLQSQGASRTPQKFTFDEEDFFPSKNRHWAIPPSDLEKVAAKGQLIKSGNSAYYKLFWDYSPGRKLANVWLDTQSGGFNDSGLYVVQTTVKVIQRCVLMSTDPGDLVFDPTCGSGTTAVVAEEFGRRWITADTSRIALNIAKARLMTAVYPFYQLYDDAGSDVRQGFKYETSSHTTLSALAKDEPIPTVTLFDRPFEDKKKLRVTGPFMVETLQNFEPILPDDIEEENAISGEPFEHVVKSHLLATGIKNGRKDEWVKFSRIEILAGEHLHAEGFYMNGTGEKKAYFHIGPKFGGVSKSAVTKAIVECRARGDASWLIILGFSFESDIEGGTITASFGNFEVTKARIHDDLLQEGLKKKPAKSAASFVTIGEPDIGLERDGADAIVEIRGLDIYDPIKDEVKARDLHDIAYWMVDDNYDGSNFVVKQVFFCGGDKDEFAKWKKGIDTLAKDKTRMRAEKTLKIEIDEEAFDQVYGYRSHPITIKSTDQRIAVRVISQYGEESMKVLKP